MHFEKVSLEAFMRELGKCGFKEGYLTAYKNIKIPERKTKFSCGYDFVTPMEFTLHPGCSITIPTGIKAVFEPEEKERYHLSLHVRSSVGIRRDIILSNGTGIIDADYAENPDNEGCILMALYNRGDHYRHFEAGERVMQGIFDRHGLVADDEVDAERIGGVGSTGKSED